MEVSLKRTRRIAIVKYSRRVTLTSDDADANATATAEYQAAIDTLLMTPGDTPAAPEDADDAQAVESEPYTPQRRPWFWLAWLKRE